jgi:hypothetical protein
LQIEELVKVTAALKMQSVVTPLVRFTKSEKTSVSRRRGDRCGHAAPNQAGNAGHRLAFLVVSRPGGDAMMLEFDTGQPLPWPGWSAA